MLSDLGRYDEAIAQLRRTLPLAPDSVKTRTALGTALLRSAASTTRSRSTRGAASLTEDPKLHNNLGVAMQQLNE